MLNGNILHLYCITKRKLGKIIFENESEKNSILMTVFVNIHNDSFLPTKNEISQSCSNQDRDGKITIVGHKYQHQSITDHNLKEMEKCL